MSTTRSPDQSKKPFVENYPPLKAWLDRNQAKCQFQQPYGKHMIEGWLVAEVMVVIIVYADRGGWDLFTPCQDTNIEATLRDAAARTGGVP